MKFRYKVLLTNLILLSLSLWLVGYFMIRKNFELAQTTQLRNAIVENNLFQSSVEYELLQIINSGGSRISEKLAEIAERVMGGMFAESSSLYVRYADAYVYSSDGKEESISEALFEELDIGGKNYMICREKGKYFIYVTSYSNVDKQQLCIISKQEASDVYNMLEEQIQYFRMLTLGIVLSASVLMYLISMLLTRPLETLNQVTGEITAGNYEIHLRAAGKDEVGQLAENVNIMAAAIRERVEELNDMVHRREQFVADFTHEIKTPMTTVIGYADMLRSMELSREELLMASSYIFSEGKRLEAMSGKLFELIYLNRHEIEKTPVHTDDLQRELLRIAVPILERKQIELKADVEPAVLMGDKELLITVCMNLIDNARKASEEGSVIELIGRSCKDGEILENDCKPVYSLRVTDYGIGMSKEDAAHICDEFYMVDKSRSRKEGGAGLGLSLTALIIKRHQAVLKVESVQGEGTTMRVIFYETK